MRFYTHSKDIVLGIAVSNTSRLRYTSGAHSPRMYINEWTISCLIWSLEIRWIEKQ